MRSLFVVFVLSLSIPVLSAQKSAEPPGPYVSARVGAGGAFDGGAYVGAQLSGGYQWNRWVGAGVSLGAYLNLDLYSSSFTGAALQYRVRPGRQWAVTADVGLVWGYSEGTNAVVYEYIPDAYPFMKTFVTWRPFRSFNIGLGWVGVPAVRYLYCLDYTVQTEECTPLLPATSRWTASGVLFTLGLTLE